MNSLALLALAALLQAPLEKTGPHFRIVSHVPLEALADDALEAAEAAWPFALEALGLEEKPLEAPLTIHLYPDAASYAAAEAELTKGAFKSNLTFSHFASRSAHVALQPPAAPEVLLAFGLPMLTRYCIAHESTHLVAFAFLPNALDHPEWFAEGGAMHVALQALEKLGRMRKQIEEPLAAKSLQHCREMLAKGTLPTAKALLSGQLGELGFQPRYAVSLEFYAFLRAKEPKELARVVGAIRTTGGGDGYPQAVAASMEKIWSDRELEKLSGRFEDFLQPQKPSWDEVLRSLETRGTGYVQRAFAEKNAIAFRVDDPLDSLPAKLAGTIHFWPGTSQQMNVLLGRSEQGFLSVAFTAGQGVTVFRCDYGEVEQWTRLAFGASDALPPGADVPFAIAVAAKELVVTVAGAEVARAALGGRSPLGPWGLGAQAGSTGEWKDVTVKKGR